ncbi:hypothetical protein ACFO3I_03295 [Rheinheimera marina]|uniref:FHA domain-containing protein n=1 Tax=Rheinheimera marina TaxID=1774958 RepID=A0ABV9JHY3_9GAMM
MDLSVNLVEGVMLESSKHSSTSVYSTGRGTRNDPVRVHSQTNTVQEFWLKKLDGTESKITLNNREVQAREGHRLILLQGESEDGLVGYVGYLNLDTDRYVIFNNSGIARAFAGRGLPFYIFVLLAFIAGGLVVFAKGFAAGFFAWALGLFAAIFVRNIHGFFIGLTLSSLTKQAVQTAKRSNSFTSTVERHSALSAPEGESHPRLQN